MRSWILLKTFVGCVHFLVAFVNAWNIYDNYTVTRMFLDQTTSTMSQLNFITVFAHMRTHSSMHSLQFINIILSLVRIIWVSGHYNQATNSALIVIPQLGYILIYMALIIHWENIIRIIKHNPPVDGAMMMYIYGFLMAMFVFTLVMSIFEFIFIVNLVFVFLMLALMICGINNSVILIYHYNNLKRITKQANFVKNIDRIMLDVKCRQHSDDNLPESNSPEEELSQPATNLNSADQNIVSDTTVRQYIQRQLSRLSDKLPRLSTTSLTTLTTLSLQSSGHSTASIATYHNILNTIYSLMFVIILSTVTVVFSIIIIILKISLNIQEDTFGYYLYMIGIHVIQECTIASIITFATFTSINAIEL